MGDAVPLTGTASSGLPVSYVSETEAVCSVENATLTLQTQGLCSVAASQAGDEAWLPAPGVTAQMFVKLPQAITFDLPVSGVVGGSVQLTAGATSGLEVSLVSNTSSVCTIAGASLSLVSLGTCAVSASQAGDDVWVAAEDVVAVLLVTLPPFTSPDGASIGRYAFNGMVNSLALDPDTGITYVGGPFTQVGVRTGAVAVVDPPGSGSDDLDPDNPDVIGSSVVLFPDDGSGYFMTGAIGSISGDGVHRRGTMRMRADGTLDTTWSSPDPCLTGAEPRWDLGDRLAAPVSMADPGYSNMGLAFIDKATGAMTFAGGGDAACASSARIWGSVGVFAPLAACAGWSICAGYVFAVTTDEERNLLFTENVVISRLSLDNATYRIRHYLVAHDMDTGARRWSLELEDPQEPAGWPDTNIWEGQTSSMVSLDGALLVEGRFPLDHAWGVSTQSSMLLIDEATGDVLQRWNAGGEQDLDDPEGYVAPASTCTPVHPGGYDYVWTRLVRLDAGTAVGYASLEQGDANLEIAVCSYGITGSGSDARLAAERLGMIEAAVPAATVYALPSILHGGRYLVGPYGAFDLQTEAQVAGWNPEPSAVPNSIVSITGGIVLGGNIVFIHGAPASHVAALDPSLTPVAGFTSELLDTSLSGNGIQDVRDVALAGGALVVAGDLKGGFGRGPVASLDLVTGEVLWGRNEASLTIGHALAVDGTDDSFYVALERFEAGALLQRYEPSGLTFALDGAFSHTIGAYDGVRYLTAVQLIGDHLYIGGLFGSVDGQSREGLARFTDGVLDGWDPQPISELDVDPADTVEMQPHTFVELNDDVIVSGNTHKIQPGGLTIALSSLLVYHGTTGARVRPSGTNAAWYPDDYWAFDMVVLEGNLYVAMGGSGVAAFSPTTYDYLPSRSTRTQPGWSDNSILALGVRTEASPPAARPALLAGLADTASVVSSSLVLGGDLGHWNNVSAGNVVEVLPSDRVTVNRSGTGKGTVTSQPAGIACGSTCSSQFPLGSGVQLTATPVPGAVFTGWSGSGCSGTGTCSVSVTTARTVTASFADKAKPTVASVATGIRSGVSLPGTSIPLRITWVGADTGGAGIKRYEVARSTDGGTTWTTLTTSLTSAAHNAAAPSSGSVRFRVRAVDKAGNVGSWVAGATVRPRLVQQTSASIAYGKTWTSVTNASCSGGSARYASVAGASATYTFTGRALAFVTTTASNRGQARIYVNGALVATIDLRSSTAKYRVLAWQVRWTTSATRTVKVVVVGTSGRPRVDLDAIAVLR